MKIKKITYQARRDFSAILECEHCEETQILTTGYDDDNYHQNVIPKMVCKSCGQCSPDDYRPLTTKYPAHAVI